MPTRKKYLTYKMYTGSVEPDVEEKILFGKVLGISDLVTFQGENLAALETDFKESVDEYLEFCKERGKEPEKPYSGKILLRLPSELHAVIALEAKEKNTSINAMLSELLSKTFHREDISPRNEC